MKEQKLKYHEDCEFYDPESKSWSILKARLGRWRVCEKKCQHKDDCTVFEHASNFYKRIGG